MLKLNLKMQINRNAPLFDKDTENKTFGCRHTNSLICKNNSLADVCAFVRRDKICTIPPASWKKQFFELSMIKTE